MKFTIYQVKADHTRKYGFMPIEFLKEHTPEIVSTKLSRGEERYILEMGHYEEVYKANAKILDLPSYTPASEVLEHVFHKFNVAHPEDYRGRSLSVSDVVKVGASYYYCDSFGWQKVIARNVPKKDAVETK